MSNRETLEVIEQFNSAFQQHDPALLEEIVAEDCVIENTQPAPNGELLVGREACLANWQGLAAARDTHFDLEEVFVTGERAIILFRPVWLGGQSGGPDQWLPGVLIWRQGRLRRQTTAGRGALAPMDNLSLNR